MRRPGCGRRYIDLIWQRDIERGGGLRQTSRGIPVDDGAPTSDPLEEQSLDLVISNLVIEEGAYSSMGKKSLAELTADPFLRTLEGCDDAQLLTVEQTAGFLSRSITTLAEWRASGKRPPGWIDDAGIRYPLGEVRRYAREQLERLALAPSPPAPSPRPSPTSAAEEIAKAVDPQAVEDYGLDDPILTGRRRKGVRHNSFAEFIALGAADDE